MKTHDTLDKLLRSCIERGCLSTSMVVVDQRLCAISYVSSLKLVCWRKVDILTKYTRGGQKVLSLTHLNER